uniref:Pentatricopeptide repeat-containing protein At4g31070, mitochondrial n=2 Tax=Elaeis guineensis var. tenera TaxID=51953 RepID=A0A6I9Q836_ELAGV|nr:pentatricopeptide repeat-containing protein At4g31070, mitochondrial [Elaeis guineensis]
MNSLLSMYSKHSMIDSARLLFDTAPLRDTITWNSMINCYIRNGYTFESMEKVREMHSLGCTLKPELLAAVLSVCGHVQNLSLGSAIHAHAIQNGASEACVLLPTALVDMYSRCQDLDAALKVFSLMPERNVISWTALITGCITNGVHDLSLEMFREMGVEGIKPNRATLVTVLPACGALGALKHGKEIHGYVFRHVFELEPRIVGALIDMYGRCKGAFNLASLVFERAEERDVVIWSSMLANSSRKSDYVGTMRLLHQMKKDGIKPNSVTMLAVIAACIGLAFIGYGQGVHGCILKSGLISDAIVRNSLIDMYAKIGCLDSSIRIFSEMPIRDSISYGSMIAGYGLHGHGYDALRLFNEMLEMGVKPDGITILAVLSACNHSGLVDEARKLFDNLGRSCDILLSQEHYACYIDLLGKSGKLEDACDVIRNMDMKPSPKILSSLVSACRTHGRFEAAEQLALWLINSEPENAANFTLLSLMYAEVGNWSMAEEIRRAMRERGLKKSSGSSQIQMGAL